jgi:hypothetical protein
MSLSNETRFHACLSTRLISNPDEHMKRKGKVQPITCHEVTLET